MKLLLSSAIGSVASAAPQLQLEVNKTDGTYKIALGGLPWLMGADYVAGAKASSQGGLVLVNTKMSEASDVFGPYTATTFSWADSSTSEVLMKTSFREYSEDDGLLVFEQLFPKELTLSSSNSGLAAGTIFPSFAKQTVSEADGWNCQSGQGGAKAQQEFKHSTANSESACGELCSQTSACVAFDYTTKSKSDSCRLFDTLEARLGDGGKDNRQYCAVGGVSPPLSCFSYHGTFPAMKTCSLASYEESNLGGVPLVLYNASDAALPMTVFSPLNQPMAHHMAHTSAYIGAGVKATVETIPAGWSQMFLLSAGAGINDGMMAWGARLLKFTGRPIVDNRYLDDSHGGIGFWTDNGGYYHYSIGDNESLGKTYEEVLPKVKAYHDELGVPFKHWQFDSWFYPKDGPVSGGGGGGAVTNWTADPKIFPSGMANIQKIIGLPTIMHNRQWSTISDYVHNWTDIDWYFSEKAAVPKDPVKFFNRFFTQQEGWGLSMYEQDWMVTEYNDVEALQTNISMGDLWLYGMAEGAARSNRTVQYCMPLPSQVLSASYLPAVTNVRATGDYHPNRGQWAIGQTALFYWALNILPFKDGFYSSTNKQIGGQSVGPELHPDREALMATLSTAMVGPMDGIYLLNASRVMTTCRSDGQVLKPDRPLTPPDACFLAGKPTCHVYQTYSNLKGLGKVRYYYNDDGTAPLLSAEVDVAEPSSHAVYNWYSGELSILQVSNQMTAGYEGHIYASVVPIVSGWVFVGEVDKYVVASTLRFPEVSVKEAGITAIVTGVAGETVKVCAAQATTLELACKTVTFANSGNQQVTFSSAAVVL